MRKRKEVHVQNNYAIMRIVSTEEALEWRHVSVWANCLSFFLWRS